MQSSINQRIKIAIQASDYKNVSVAAKAFGVPRPTLDACVRGVKEPRATIITSVLSGLPSLSAEWLMRGEGPMMRGAPSPPPPEPLGGADDEVVRLRAENAVLREQLERTQEMLMGAIGGRKE